MVPVDFRLHSRVRRSSEMVVHRCMQGQLSKVGKEAVGKSRNHCWNWERFQGGRDNHGSNGNEERRESSGTERGKESQSDLVIDRSGGTQQREAKSWVSCLSKLINSGTFHKHGKHWTNSFRGQGDRIKLGFVVLICLCLKQVETLSRKVGFEDGREKTHS